MTSLHRLVIFIALGCLWVSWGADRLELWLGPEWTLDLYRFGFVYGIVAPFLGWLCFKGSK